MSKPKKGKAKPMTPEEIAVRRAAEREAAKQPGNWGADGAALRVQLDVKVVMTSDKKRVQTARRDDGSTASSRAGRSASTPTRPSAASTAT